jgi:hypothetical protein
MCSLRKKFFWARPKRLMAAGEKALIQTFIGN